MTKRKLRFNAIDAIIILAVAAVLFVLLYIFVFDKDNGQTSASDFKPIQYTIMIQNIDEANSNIIKVGQPVTDAIKKKSIGTVVGVQVAGMTQTSFNYETEKEVYSPVEGRVSLKVTIEGDAEVTDREFTIDDLVIRVGHQYSLMFPEIYCVGFCIDLNDNLNK